MVAALESFESAIDELVRERREIDALEANWLAKVADYTSSGQWQGDGYLNAASALRDRCHMTPANARASVRLARKLGHLPAIAAAFRSGEISRGHASVVAGAYTQERAAELDGIEGILAEAARHVNPDDLSRASDEAIHARRRLHSSLTMGGVVGKWFLDPEGGETVHTALDAQIETDKLPGDTRTPAQRRADAFVEICRRSLASDAHPESASTRRRGLPHISAVVDIRAYESTHPDLVADIRAEAAHVGRLSQATIERLMCECEITRTIMDGPTEIIDVGRATRTPSAKLWKALIVRDRHCQAFGCKQPPRFCQPHHIVHWTKNGPTNLDNLKLLCWHHHRQEHAHDPPKRE